MEKVTITLDQNELAAVAAGLGELPFKIAAPVFESINKQIMEQQSPPPENVNIYTEDDAQ